MPTVSVVMATYNGARFINDQLTSLAKQSELPAELIVADDGSADGTLQILEQFRENAPFPVRIIENESRLGYGESFLNAARFAEGDYIAFCDQDDVWHPEKIEVALRSLSESGSSLLVHTARLIDQDGRVFGTFSQGITRDEVRPPLTHYPWSVYYGFSMVFDRSLLTLIDASERGRHTFEHHGKLSHDLWVYFLGTSLGDTNLDTRALADYRRHRDNATPPVSRRSFRAWTSSLGVVASRELRRDAIAAHRSALLDRLSRSSSDQVIRDRTSAASEYWGRIAAHESSRLSLYTDPSVLRRVIKYLLLLISGAYRSASNGGLGLRLSLKDVLAGVMNLRRTRPEVESRQR